MNNMTPEEFTKITDIIKVTIKETVNGKIDRLDIKLDTYMKEDNDWKDRANPTIELGNNVRGFGKVMVYLLGIAGAIFALIKYTK